MCSLMIAGQEENPAKAHNAAAAEASQSAQEEKRVETQAERWKREEVMRRGLGRDSDDELLQSLLLTVGLPTLIIVVLAAILRLRE